jgi:hypothetical protein
MSGLLALALVTVVLAAGFAGLAHAVELVVHHRPRRRR